MRTDLPAWFHLAVATSLAVLFSASPGWAVPTEDARAQLAALRVPFIVNQGQVDPRVAYYAPMFAGTLFVTGQGELVYALRGQVARVPGRRTEASVVSGWTLTETFVGGRGRPIAQTPVATGVNILIGSDSGRWRSGVRAYEQVTLGAVWPDVTVSLHVRGNNIEKVFTVRPGGSPERIRLRIDGAQALTVKPEGVLVADTGLGAVTFTAPVAYQERDGVRRPVAVAYRPQGLTYGFTVAAYDPSLPLVIDPLLQSTYLGGTGVDRASGLAIHPGDVYVAGTTTSLNFPGAVGGAQPANGGGSDIFVSRLTSTLTALIQTTYLGGSGDDNAAGLAIHPTTGDVYVAGATLSLNFPGVAGGAQPAHGGGGFDAFVARLPSTLTSLTQATYLGGTGPDGAAALAIHPTTGDVYVAGGTTLGTFPGTPGGAQPAIGSAVDGFVARLPATLTSLTQATFLGGSQNDQATALVIHPASGDVYAAGFTISPDFPSVAGDAQPVHGGENDGFVSRLTSTLTAFVQSTYLGGSAADSADALAIHPTTGDVYVAGSSRSDDFPGTAGAAQSTRSGEEDVFVARLPGGAATEAGGATPQAPAAPFRRSPARSPRS